MAESPFDDDVSEISELTNSPSLEATENYEKKRQRWEENVVKRIMIAGGKGKLIRPLIQQHFERTNEYKLTFEDFKHLACPEFPLYLSFEKISYQLLAKVEVQLMRLSKASKNALVKHWEAVRDSCHVVHCQGIVFEWLHHGSPYKIIHDHHLTAVTYPWTRIQISLPNDHDPLFLEDLDSYLHSINWVK